MTQTVMVVEDERLVRTLAARILRDAGLEVVEAPDGREAWRQLQSLAPTIHLLLSDVVMPHMSGIELAGRVSQAWPDLPVLLMTAFTPEQLADRGLNEGHWATLTKPLRRRRSAGDGESLHQGAGIGARVRQPAVRNPGRRVPNRS